MPLEAKPLFRPDVLRTHLGAFAWPDRVEAAAPKLRHWAELFASRRADSFKEQELLPDFLTDFFCGLLRYTRPADGQPRYTLSREKHVEVDGKFADAVLGDFNGEQRYKGADQHTFERFDTEQLADDAAHLKRFVFLLGAERVVPAAGRCHLYSLWDESQKVGRELTRDFYQRYADMRQNAFQELARDNADAPRGEVLSATQKLLDRVLFCAFCEDRGLLPTETIRKAFEHRDPYRPHTIWDNFRGLFDSINRGNAALGIHAYNGGLLAPDPLLDRRRVSDAVCSYFRDLGSYDYRPPSQAAFGAGSPGAPGIDVEILGHIFEQSISDLEKLRNEVANETHVAQPGYPLAGAAVVRRPLRRPLHSRGRLFHIGWRMGFPARHLTTRRPWKAILLAPPNRKPHKPPVPGAKKRAPSTRLRSSPATSSSRRWAAC